METQPPRMPAAGVDAAGTILREVHCRQCGYDLRGLQLDGRCPECAADVEWSVHGDLLQFADPAWVAKLAKGSRLLVRGLNGWVAALFILCAVLIVVSALPLGSGLWSPTLSVVSVCGVVVALLAVLYSTVAVCRGFWLHTAPDPSIAEAGDQLTTRRLARLSIFALLLVIAMQWVILHGAGALSTVRWLLRGLQLGLGAFVTVGLLAYLRYMRDIVARLDHERLLRTVRSLRRDCIILSIMIWASVLLPWLLTFVARTAAFAPASAPTSAPAAALGSGFTGIRALQGLSMVGVFFVLTRFTRWQAALRKPLIAAAKAAAEEPLRTAPQPDGDDGPPAAE